MSKSKTGGRPRSRSERARWYSEVLEHQAASGLTIVEYAHGIGVAPATLYEWRRRLATESCDDQSPATPFGLVEVAVEPEPVASPNGMTFVVQLGCGRAVEVPAGFIEADLRRLVRLLESC
jgi:transposase-like protein